MLPKRFFRAQILCALMASSQFAFSAAAKERNCPDCTFTKAYDAAKVYGSKKNHGVVLYLHDCEGLDLTAEWQLQWLDFLNQNGFSVVAIDSFADTRPPADACEADPWLNLYTKVKIYAVRKLQAEHAVEMIKAAFPGQKIFVWGHAEGAVAAQLIAEKIDGVISTGAPCSTEWLPGIADVPLLVIQGTEDPRLQDDKTTTLYGSLDERCESNMTQPKWEWLTVKGMGNAVDLSRKTVKDRVSKFLRIAPTR